MEYINENEYILNITKEIILNGIDKAVMHQNTNTETIDIEKLLLVLEKHKLTGVISEYLENDFPNSNSIIQQKISNYERNLLYMKEMIKICNKFQTSGISYIVVKGIPLSKMIYGKEFSRRVGDIDIIVKEKNMIKGYKILKSMGYNQFQNEDNDDFVYAYGSFYHEVQMFKNLNSQPYFFVELKRGTSAVGYNFDRWFDHAYYIEIGGQTINTLDFEYSVMHLFSNVFLNNNGNSVFSIQ